MGVGCSKVSNGLTDDWKGVQLEPRKSLPSIIQRHSAIFSDTGSISKLGQIFVYKRQSSCPFLGDVAEEKQHVTQIRKVVYGRSAAEEESPDGQDSQAKLPSFKKYKISLKIVKKESVTGALGRYYKLGFTSTKSREVNMLMEKFMREYNNYVDDLAYLHRMLRDITDCGGIEFWKNFRKHFDPDAFKNLKLDFSVFTTILRTTNGADAAGTRPEQCVLRQLYWASYACNMLGSAEVYLLRLNKALQEECTAYRIQLSNFDGRRRFEGYLDEFNQVGRRSFGEAMKWEAYFAGAKIKTGVAIVKLMKHLPYPYTDQAENYYNYVIRELDNMSAKFNDMKNDELLNYFASFPEVYRPPGFNEFEDDEADLDGYEIDLMQFSALIQDVQVRRSRDGLAADMADSFHTRKLREMYNMMDLVAERKSIGYFINEKAKNELDDYDERVDIAGKDYF